MAVARSDHHCEVRFRTDNMGDCAGVGVNECIGNDPMSLRVWYMDHDGIGGFYDEWIEVMVKFCPWCGKKAESYAADESW
jgi:hypothetical protein